MAKQKINPKNNDSSSNDETIKKNAPIPSDIPDDENSAVDDEDEFEQLESISEAKNKEIVDAAIKKVNDIPTLIVEDDMPKTPLSRPVIKRSYTDASRGLSNNSTATTVEERIIPEPVYENIGRVKPLEEEEEFMKNINDIPNNKSNDSSSNTQRKKVSDIPEGDSSANGLGGQKQPTPPPKSTPLGGDNLDGLSNKKQKEAYEITADSILHTFKTIAPIPFIWLGSYNLKKIKRLHNDGKIDANMIVPRVNMPFIEYASSFNEQVAETAMFTDEEIMPLREPLIEVLKENKMALTPTQNFFLALGGTILPKFQISMQQKMQNSEMLEEMMDLKRLEIEAIRTSSQRPIYQPPYQPANNQAVETPIPEQKNENSQQASNGNSDAVNNKSQVVDIDNFINSEEGKKNNIPNDIPE